MSIGFVIPILTLFTEEIKFDFIIFQKIYDNSTNILLLF